MSKSATLKKDIRFQQWVDQVQAFQSRPAGMSMTAWCREQGVAVSTFVTRLHKVQDRYLVQSNLELPLSVSSTEVVPVASPSFVELPVMANAEAPATVAVINCGNAKIEISEDISETFLLKLIGAVCHAQ